MAKPKEKKQLHEAEEGASASKPTKKKKKSKETINVKIQTIGENPEKISPLVGYFPSGYDPLKDGVEEEPDPEASVKVYRNTQKSNRMQLVVSPNGTQLDFVGTNYSGESAAPQLCTYALGVLDKETHTLKIVPVAANKIFRLDPRVRGSNLPENEQLDVVKKLSAEEKASKQRATALDLNDRRVVRRIKKQDMLGHKEDPQSQQELNGEIKIDEAAIKADVTAISTRNIPPHNLDAASPEMAYPLDKIIHKGEWGYLLDLLELSQSGAEVTSDVYPSFVCNRVYKLDQVKDESEKKKLAGILSYITHLVKFKDKHSMDGVSAAKSHKVPGILFNRFSSMFAISEKKRLPDEKRDLLISYVLVLTLFADNFRTDPSDIAKDLRVNQVQLRLHLENLGCKLVREKQVLLATLPVPLQFPNQRKKRRR